jgi:hypothetical protein
MTEKHIKMEKFEDIEKLLGDSAVVFNHCVTTWTSDESKEQVSMSSDLEPPMSIRDVLELLRKLSKEKPAS